jgi:hypothetical protein
MSSQDPPYQAPTAPYPTSPAPVAFPPLAPPPPQDDYIADDDEEWVTQAPKGLRIPPITGVLVLILFAVCGLWGGAVLQKHRDKSTQTTTGTGAAAAGATGAAAARRAAAAGGFGGFGGAAGAAGAAGGGRTTGTVSDVEGSTVFLTDSSGNIVKINLAPATKITKTSSGTAADIQLGQTLIVSGAKGTDGSTSASTITISPAGTGAGTGGTGGAGAPPGTGAAGTGAAGAGG